MEIFIPDSVFMVGEDESAKVEGGYRYLVKAVHYKDGKDIPIERQDNNKTAENLLSNLFYSYKKADVKLMTELFNRDGQKRLKAIGTDKFTVQLDYLSKIEKPQVQYVVEHRGGLIISWYDKSYFSHPRKLFIKKEKDEYKIAHFHADKDEHFFENINLYFATYPFELAEPKIKESFSKIKNGEAKKLSFEVKRENNFVHLFKSDDKSIKLSLKDNYVQEGFPLNDLSEKKKFIEVKLKGENFRDAGKHELFYLESSYPMSVIPKDAMKYVKKITIIKE